MDLKFDFTVGFSKPPVTTNLYTFQDLDLDVLRRIKSSIHETIEKLKDDKEISTEAEILRKLHYKFKNQWRREKVLKSIKQVHNVWMKFKSIDLIRLLNELKDLLPNRVFGRETTYLPSFLLVCYVLSILLRACALLKVTSDLCVVGCQRAEQQINNYLFAQYMTICYAALSKFCVLCKTLLDTLSDCYRNVRGLSEVLRVPRTLTKGFNMLPGEVEPWLESDSFFSFHISSLFSSENEEAENGGPPSDVAAKMSGDSIMQPFKEAKSATLSSMLLLTTVSDVQLSSTIPSEQDVKDFLPSIPKTSTMTALMTNASTIQESDQSLQTLAAGDDDDDDDDDDDGEDEEEEEDNDDKASVQQQKETTTNDTTNIKKRKFENDENRFKKKAKTENMEETSGREERLSEDFVPSVGQEELEKMSGSADGCSTVGQLLSLIRELKESRKGTKLRGFKICLNKLKSTRDEIKQLDDSANNDDDNNNNASKKGKKLLLKKSKTSVKKFLAKNSI